MTAADPQQDPAFAHDPDRNPAWMPKAASRVYACTVCGHEYAMQTNHTGTVPGARCYGKCRQILNANTAREIVLPAHTPHRYVSEA